MGIKIFLVFLVFSAVVNSDDFYGRSQRMPEYLRIKRAKYYSNPPTRFYRKPPPPFLTKGAFSYTPPPNYMESEDPRPGSFRPKVSTSKRPINDGLGDDDINNLVKHLSKQDLDKIIEFAGDKYGTHEKYSTSINKLPDKTEDISIYKTPVQEIEADQKFSLNGPYISDKEPINYEMEYSDVSKRPTETNKVIYNQIQLQSVDNSPDQFAFKGPYANIYSANVQNSPPLFHQSPEISSQDLSIPLETQESMHNSQFSTLNAYIQQELHGAPSDKVVNTFTDSKVMQEEQLPKPVNLREDDYEVSYTNNVANIVKPSSYKLENFGDLPLMDYNSKRDTVSSYHVPHYSVSI